MTSPTDDDWYRIEEDFDRSAFEKRVARWPEVEEAINQIRRAPALGNQIPGTDVFSLILRSVPVLAIYYTFDVRKRVIRFLDLREL